MQCARREPPRPRSAYPSSCRSRGSRPRRRSCAGGTRMVVLYARRSCSCAAVSVQVKDRRLGAQGVADELVGGGGGRESEEVGLVRGVEWIGSLMGCRPRRLTTDTLIRTMCAPLSISALVQISPVGPVNKQLHIRCRCFSGLTDSRPSSSWSSS